MDLTLGFAEKSCGISLQLSGPNRNPTPIRIIFTVFALRLRQSGVTLLQTPP